MRSVSAELLSPKHYRPISLIKEFFQFPCQWSIPCQTHVHTHMGFQQSQAIACCGPEGQPAAQQCLLAFRWKTQPFLLCYFTKSCSYPLVRRRNGVMRGLQIKHYPFFLCSREGVLKIQKEAAGELYLCSTWHRTKTKHTCLHAKLGIRHACTGLQNWLSPSVPQADSNFIPTNTTEGLTLFCRERKHETSYDLLK